MQVVINTLAQHIGTNRHSDSEDRHQGVGDTLTHSLAFIPLVSASASGPSSSWSTNLLPVLRASVSRQCTRLGGSVVAWQVYRTHIRLLPNVARRQSFCFHVHRTSYRTADSRLLQCGLLHRTGLPR